ncbi:hypothetical protein TNCV_1669351 [Trichonephila clavipes]|nr:hypothetical protein TNCV_1669351 [Trichonephila clavipes]
MTSQNCLDDFLGMIRLEAGLSQVEVVRLIQVARKWSPAMESIPKSDSVPNTVIQDGQQLLTFRDLAAVSGRRISRQTFYSGLAQNVLYTRSRVVYVPLTASHGTDRIFVQLKTSAVFLSVISGSSPNVFI